MRTATLLVLICSAAVAADKTFKDRPPQDAAQYLSDVLPKSKRGYVNDDGFWSAFVYSEFGDGLAKNHVSYTVEGDEKKAKALILKFTIFNANGEKWRSQSERLYKKFARQLLERSTAGEWKEEMGELAPGDKKSWTVNGCKVEASYEAWETGKGYTISFTVR